MVVTLLSPVFMYTNKFIIKWDFFKKKKRSQMWWGHTYTYILRLWGLRVKGQIEDQPGVANDTMRMNKRTNHSFLHPKSITVPLASDLSEVCTMIRGCPCIRSCLFLFHRMRDGEERGLQKSVLRRVQLISVQDTD